MIEGLSAVCDFQGAGDSRDQEWAFETISENGESATTGGQETKLAVVVARQDHQVAGRALSEL